MFKSKFRRGDNRVNAGSMADIAFLLLIFFLVTTTIMSDKGIPAKLPPWDESREPISIPERNLFSVKINGKNQLLVEGKLSDIRFLRQSAKEFIMNPAAKGDLPASPKKAIISLQNDRGTAFSAYLDVYNELKAAYNELWDAAALKQYGCRFEALSSNQKKTIRDAIPLVISEAEPTDHVAVR